MPLLNGLRCQESILSYQSEVFSSCKKTHTQFKTLNLHSLPLWPLLISVRMFFFGEWLTWCTHVIRTQRTLLILTIVIIFTNQQNWGEDSKLSSFPDVFLALICLSTCWTYEIKGLSNCCATSMSELSHNWIRANVSECVSGWSPHRRGLKRWRKLTTNEESLIQMTKNN